jgi:dTDP-4-dehydrorhamnose 3,5-epimerase
LGISPIHLTIIKQSLIFGYYTKIKFLLKRGILRGVTFYKERQIANPKGDIFHIIKESSEGFNGFGEAYFTTINKGEIKGWKKHREMTLNLAVPVGEVEFVVSDKRGNFTSYKISPQNYGRLTVEPNLWVAFRGLGRYNLIINIANIPHNPDEAENIPLEEMVYEW